MSTVHIDLTRHDVYDDGVVPDEHVEIAMKVLRTLRAICLDQPLDVEGAQAMEAAYGWIHDGIRRIMDEEEAREAGEVINDTPTTDVLVAPTVQPDEGTVPYTHAEYVGWEGSQQPEERVRRCRDPLRGYCDGLGVNSGP